MLRLTNFSISIWISVSIIALYLIDYFTAGYYASKFHADLFALTFATFMSVSTFFPAYDAFKFGISTRGDRFLFSYWLIWTFFLLQRIWVIIIALNTYDGIRPTYLVESFISGLIAIGIGIAGGFGLVAPITGPDKILRTQIITMTIAGTISGIVAGIAIGVYIVSGWID